MFANVETGNFFFFIGPDGHEQADDFKDYECSDDSQRIGDDRRNELSGEEMAAAVEEAVGTGRVDVCRCPEPRCDGAPSTADAVNPEGIEGIVVAEFGLDDGDSDIADNAADSPDNEGRKGSDEACCRGDGDEACDTSGSGTEDGRFPLDTVAAAAAA